MANDKVQFNQINTIGANQSRSAIYPVLSKNNYECANAHITRGSVMIPWTLDDCLETFPGIKNIAIAIGFYTQGSSGSSGGSGESGGYTLWDGKGLTTDINTFTTEDVYFDTPNYECEQIKSTLGLDWLGCIWGTPSAPYSCSCPDIGPKFEAYVKHRLNVASFWNTPVETPVKRAEFNDALQYGRKIDVVIPGDFSLRVGMVARLRINGISGFPFTFYTPSLNGYYYILGIKHVATNSGTHETSLTLSQIAAENVNSIASA